MDEDLKKKAAEALKAGADAAKRLGGIACDLGKRGCAAAGEKVRELAEKAKEAKRKAKEEAAARRQMEEEEARLRMEEERRRMESALADAAERSAGERPPEEEHSVQNNVVATGADNGLSDPEDKSLLFSYGWLYFIWWLFNIVDTFLCLLWFGAMVKGYHTQDMAWIPIAVWLVALLMNRLGYEGAVAFFEMVRHLRQIRDELRKHNMREDRKQLEANERLQKSEITETDGEGCQNGI